ncbi:glycosyltransferase [Methylobacterium sp. A52T]
MNVIFVNYGLFNSNSGGHIAHFANELVKQGAKVLVVGQNDGSTAADFGPVGFETVKMPLSSDDLPSRVVDFASDPKAIVHAWTPRGHVQHFVNRLVQRTKSPYLVHLEDNEEVLLAASLGISVDKLLSLPESQLDEIVPATLSHPHKARSFLERSVGISAIVESLLKFAPYGKLTHILEPGVDAEQFSCDIAEEQQQRLRQDLYIDDDALITVYNGNTHSANYRDIFSLYTSILILRRRGFNINLIRTGRDYFDRHDASFPYINGDWVIDLGVLPRRKMIEVLKLADFFIQPGGCDEFNTYRLPSKLPEFLSLGKPVILPAVNIGRRLNDGRNALLLFRGDATEIADKVETLLKSGQSMLIGKAGREFAISNFNWALNAESLMKFYNKCHTGGTKLI